MVSTNQSQLLTKFATKSLKYAIADVPYSIPTNSTNETLNNLVKYILKESKSHDEHFQESLTLVDFDFLINGEYLVTSLEEYINQREDFKAEETLEIEYTERYPAPEPIDSIELDDWISSVRGKSDMILVGCYDNTVQLWTTEATKLAVLTGHSGPVKTVAWISYDNDTNIHRFVSASHDQSLIIWTWNQNKNTIDNLEVGIGHKESVECLDVNLDATKLVSGSWDCMLKLWSLNGDEQEQVEINGSNKRSKSELKTKNITPIITLSGHTQNISSAKWMDDKQVCTCSWDHSIKIWDMYATQEVRSFQSQNKVFLSVDYSKQNGTLIAGLADRHVRLYDPRSSEGSLVKSTFTSHTGWVSSVKWSPQSEYLFTSGSYDCLAKLWDVRSPRAPLYDMAGHEDKILAIDWSSNNQIITGSADNTFKIFNADNTTQKIKKNQFID